MSWNIDTWGELCRVAGLDPRGISADTRVRKLPSAANVVDKGALKNPDAPACARTNCCGGVCGA
jgi:hypothetical protein